MTALSPWVAAARHFEVKPRTWATPGAMATALDHTHRQTAMLDLIDAQLVELFDGTDDRNLMIFCPPQEGKSQKVSRRTPAWLLSHDPTLRIAIVSYQAKKAERWGKAVRRDIFAHPELDITLMSDSRASDKWETTAGGGMISVGIEGGITGEPVDCLRGDTRILTEYGYARIDEIHRAGAPFPRVLSYSHQAQRAEWRPIVATRAIADRPIVEVRTSSGRVINCTPDHRVYVEGRGYVAAADVQPGERLLVAGHCADHLCGLLNGVHPAEVHPAETHAWHTAALLPGVPVYCGASEPDLRGLRDDLLQDAFRGGEGQAQRLQADVLHEGVLPRHTDSRATARGAAGSSDPDRGTGHIGGDADLDGAAHLLRSRGRRAVGREEQGSRLRELRESPQVQEPHMQGVLPGGSRLDATDRDLLAVQRDLPADARGGREEETRRTDRTILFAGMPRQMDVSPQCANSLPAVRHIVQWPRAEVLHSRVPKRSPAPETHEEVSGLRDRIRVLQHAPAVLHSEMRERGALAEDGRRGELALQGRDELRRVVPAHASAHPRTGSGPVPGVLTAELPGADRPHVGPVGEVQPVHSPPERGPGGQPAGEPHRPVPRMPWDSPQVGHDTVSVVRHLHGVRDTVYDLQVDGNRNFFADEVLVHNCLIIDDPVRGRAEAESATYREAAWDWWESNGSTRLSSRAKVVLMMCMTGDTLVLLPDGAEKPLRDVRPGDEVATYEGGGLTTSTVMNWANQGPDDLFRIRMKSGRFVRANARHPFLTIDANGEEKWLRTDQIQPGVSILTATGGNGAESPVLLTTATYRRAVRACATPTTTRPFGHLATARLRSMLRRVAELVSSIVTGSPMKKLTSLSANRMGNAPSADSRRRTAIPEPTGTGSYASTTITTPERCADCSATTATSLSDTGSQPQSSGLPLTTWRVTPDEVVAVEPCGREDVFDLQIARTENFIANGLVSHNTRWHEDDLAGRLEAREPGDWRTVRIPAIAGPGDPLGRRPGEELVSVQKRTSGYFRKLQQTRSAYVWNSIFQQTPTAAEGNLFKRQDFRYWQQMPADRSWHGVMAGQRVDLGGRTVMLDDCWRFITVDLAASKRTSADWTVASAWAISPDGDLVLLDRNRGRLEEAEHWDHVRPLQQRWHADTVFIEQSFISTTLAVDATAAGIPVQPLTADTDKITRAIPATNRLRQGRVWFPAHVDWLDDWCDELASFPSAAHDDQVDTLSYAARVVSAHWLPSETALEVEARRSAQREDGPIEQAYAAATGGSAGLDLMSINY